MATFTDGETLRDQFVKLGEEYTKLKTKNTLLRKACVEEKKKTEDLEKEVREKDEEIRKKLGEIDNLNYNVERLRTRCAKLIKDVEEAKAQQGQSGGGWMSWMGGSGGNAKLEELAKKLQVAEGELASQIKENERVHGQMYEQREAHEAQLKMMTSKVEELKSALRESEAKDQENKQGRLAAQEEVARLRREYVELRHLMDQRLDQAERRLRTQQEYYQRLSHALQKELTRIRRVLVRKLPFDESVNKRVAMNNLPTYSRRIVTSRRNMLVS